MSLCFLPHSFLPYLNTSQNKRHEGLMHTYTPFEQVAYGTKHFREEHEEYLQGKKVHVSLACTCRTAKTHWVLAFLWKRDMGSVMVMGGWTHAPPPKQPPCWASQICQIWQQFNKYPQVNEEKRLSPPLKVLTLGNWLCLCWRPFMDESSLLALTSRHYPLHPAQLPRNTSSGMK